MAVVVALVAAVGCAVGAANMNGGGPYTFNNPNSNAQTQYNTDYGTKNAKYFDVYAGPITTRYGEVFWRGLPTVPLPPDIVNQFDGKVMAVIGYEQDQVMVDGAPGANPEKDQSVPIYWAYNHHYVAWLKGKHATFVKLNETDFSKYGHPMEQVAVTIDDPNPDSTIPTSQFFSEGNGGESRKSYHGYPQGNGGRAQLIESPNEFQITPMQIDTWNRDTKYGDPFVPGPESTASQAPVTGPDAIYSGHLECPCTDRITKTIKETFATQSHGVCPTAVDSADQCFKASAALGFAPSTVRNASITDPARPQGCFLEDVNGTVTMSFNSYTGTDTSCGPKPGSPVKMAGSASEYVDFSVVIDTSADTAAQVTISLSGPADVWFGVGLGAQVMKDAPNAIIVDANGTVFEQKLADQSPGSQLPTSVKVETVRVVNNTRTVTLTRALKGLTAAHYTFDPTKAQIPFINAIGRGPHLAYHQSRGAAVLNLLATGSPTCVCSTGIVGYISSDMNPSPAEFRKGCAGEPYGDLVQLHNPTCTIEQYKGGLKCCTSGNILLDKDQNPWENNTLTYYMKWRFWYQDYTPPTDARPASHQNLLRFWHETEVGAGEYDIIKAPDGTAPEDTVYTITAHFQTRNAVSECDPRTSPHCGGDIKGGVNMVYMSCHCHAPACISCELYNADTGELICSQIPTYGKSPAASSSNPYDEQGYIAVPPCLFGSESEGLYPEVFLAYDQNLTSIKKNNNTYGHYGEMAMWQSRGYQAYQPARN